MRWHAAEEDVSVGLRFAIVGVLLMLVALGLGVAVAAAPTALDRWWNDLVGSVTPMLLNLALAMNIAGGGLVAVLVVPLGGALALVLARRGWAAVLFLSASVLSALIVQGMKNLLGRARPDDMLVVSDHGSFPSGHVANAATIAAIAVIVFPRLWVALVGAGWVALMALSRTALHVHWLTDTIGGALVGVGAALLVSAAFVLPLRRENRVRSRLASARGSVAGRDEAGEAAGRLTT